MISAFIDKYLIWFKLAGLAALAAGSFYCGFTLESDIKGKQLAQKDVAYGKLKQEYSDATIQAQADALQKDKQHAKQLEEVLNEDAKKRQVIERDRDAARAANNSLSDQLAENKRKLSSATAEAARSYAAALSDVFQECAARYTEVAAKADGHAADALTCSAAWPK